MSIKNKCIIILIVLAVLILCFSLKVDQASFSGINCDWDLAVYADNQPRSFITEDVSSIWCTNRKLYAHRISEDPDSTDHTIFSQNAFCTDHLQGSTNEGTVYYEVYRCIDINYVGGNYEATLSYTNSAGQSIEPVTVTGRCAGVAAWAIYEADSDLATSSTDLTPDEKRVVNAIKGIGSNWIDCRKNLDGASSLDEYDDSGVGSINVISSDPQMVQEGNYTIFGPFYVSGTGEITRGTIRYDGTSISSDGYDLYIRTSAGETLLRSKVQVNGYTEFYLKIADDGSIRDGDVEVNFQFGTSGSTYRARLLELRPTLGNNNQFLAIFAGEEITGSGTPATYTFHPDEPKPVSLTIQKTDENGAGLQGVTFNLYHIDSGCYVYAWSLGVDEKYDGVNYDGSDGSRDLTTFDNGKISLTGLKPGKYRLTEVSGGTILQVTSSNGKATYSKGSKDINLDLSAGGENVTVNIQNGQETTKLRVKKRDPDNGILDASFMLIKHTDGQEDEYAHRSGTGLYWLNYCGEGDNAAIFTTTNGELIINNLPVDCTYYELREIPNSSGHRVKITGATVNNKYAQAFTPAEDDGSQFIKIERGDLKAGATIEVFIENEPEGFNIRLEKKGVDGKYIEGAAFRIKVLLNGAQHGWLGQDASGAYRYDLSLDDKIDWITPSSGPRLLQNLDEQYTYQIYEYAPAPGYGSLQKQIDSGMTVSVNNSPLTPVLQSLEPSSPVSGIYCGEVNKAGHGWTVTIKATNQAVVPFSISIEKKDTLGNNVEGAGFKVRVYDLNKWLGENYTLEDDVTKAKEWKTDANGKISLIDLDDQYTYQVYETSPAPGHKSLQDQLDKNIMQVTVGNVVNSDLVYEEGIGVKCAAVSKSTHGSSVIIKMVNGGGNNIPFTIKIVKKDSVTGSLIKGVAFRIEVLAKNGMHVGWLGAKDYNTGTYNIYSDTSKGGIDWITDGENTMVFSDLDEEYQYKVYEVGVAEDYYPIEEQLDNNMQVVVNGSNRQAVETTIDGVSVIDLGTFNLNDDNPLITLEVTNIPTSITTGINIHIEKTDKIYGNAIPGVKFKISIFDNADSNGETWLGNNFANDPNDYNRSLENSGTWITDENGRIDIQGLDPSHTYRVYETETASGYTMENQINDMTVHITDNEGNSTEVNMKDSWRLTQLNGKSALIVRSS